VLDITEVAATFALDAILQRATLTFDHRLTQGNHALTIDFHGAIETPAPELTARFAPASIVRLF
jgi:hypothetical protein